jgi:hypothetical protein
MVNTLLLVVGYLVGLGSVLERNLVDDCWNFGGRFESCFDYDFWVYFVVGIFGFVRLDCVQCSKLDCGILIKFPLYCFNDIRVGFRLLMLTDCGKM